LHPIPGLLCDIVPTSDTLWPTPESKPYFLLRMMFQLPAKARTTLFIGWLRPHESDDDPSWPIHWKGNTPEIVDRLMGSIGDDYRAQDEYLYFLKRYRYRDLSRVKIE
jgi:hypothetical protein